MPGQSEGVVDEYLGHISLYRKDIENTIVCRQINQAQPPEDYCTLKYFTSMHT